MYSSTLVNEQINIFGNSSIGTAVTVFYLQNVHLALHEMFKTTPKYDAWNSVVLFMHYTIKLIEIEVTVDCSLGLDRLC